MSTEELPSTTRFFNEPQTALSVFDEFVEVYDEQGSFRDDPSITHAFRRHCVHKKGEETFFHYRKFDNIKKELRAFERLGLAEKDDDGWVPTREGRRFYELPETQRQDWLFQRYFSGELTDHDSSVLRTAMGLALLCRRHEPDRAITNRELAIGVFQHPDDAQKAYQALLRFRDSERKFSDVVQELGGRPRRWRCGGERLSDVMDTLPFFEQNDDTVGVATGYTRDLIHLGEKARQDSDRFLTDTDNPSANELKDIAQPKKKWIVRRLVDELDLSEVEARKYAKEQAPTLFKSDQEIDDLNKDQRQQYRRRLRTFFERPHANLYSSFVNPHKRKVKENSDELADIIEYYYKKYDVDFGEGYETFSKRGSDNGISRKNKRHIDNSEKNNGKILEEYTWKLLTALDGEAAIRPNAQVSREGRLEGHADGGQGDIEGQAGNRALLAEPTWIGDSQQYKREAIQIEEHIDNLEFRNEAPYGNALRVQGQKRSIGLYISTKGQSQGMHDDKYLHGHDKRTLKALYKMAQSSKGGATTTFLPLNLIDFHTLITNAYKAGKTRSDLVNDLEELADQASQLSVEEWVRSIEEYAEALSVEVGKVDFQAMHQEMAEQFQQQGIPTNTINPLMTIEGPEQQEGFIVDFPGGYQLRLQIEKKRGGYHWQGDLRDGNRQLLKKFDEQDSSAFNEVVKAVTKTIKESKREVRNT